MGWQAALIGSTLFSAMGQAKAANAQAQAAEYNASLAKMEASAEEARRRRESSKVMGKMRAGRAKSGVTTEGTPLMVLSESAEMAELDALNARWSGETQSEAYKRKASSARSAIPYTVGATLLGGYSAYKKG
jgi:hypothetical protein